MHPYGDPFVDVIGPPFQAQSMSVPGAGRQWAPEGRSSWSSGIGRKKNQRHSNFSLLGTSLAYQTKQFFDNSTLHGVRYIREEGRPFCERFMWFCFTSIGGVATLIIISTLWEKFQTNPTITGLDTDFHNWDVPFPAVAFCMSNPANESAIEQFVNEKHGGSEDVKTFLRHLTNLSYAVLPEFQPLLNKPEALLDKKPLHEYQKEFVKQCNGVFQSCELRGNTLDCCASFLGLSTEVGYCYVFNSRLAHDAHGDKNFEIHYIRETDDRWALKVNFKVDFTPPDVISTPLFLYIQSNDMSPIIEVSPQGEWNLNFPRLSFSAKQTYTTEDTRQLSIRQRRCVFPDEIKLETDSIYTYTSCMQHCRMQMVRATCGCVPLFYPTVKSQKMCEVKDLKCLAENKEKFLLNSRNCKCDLGCMNTAYEVEKVAQTNVRGQESLDVAFVSWPIVRYKREVLFGWVDLLVSFGGIAGLFLGFSLLSSVEIVYYFTMRACCMVLRDPEELRRMKFEKMTAPKPPLDLSLTPYFMLSPEDDAGSAGRGLTRVKPIAEERRTNIRSGKDFPMRHNVLRRQYPLNFLP